MKSVFLFKKPLMLSALIIFMALSIPAFADYKIEINVPRAGDSSTIPPQKDFYVLGNIYGATADDNLELSINLLNENGEEIRKLLTNNYSKTEDFYVDYPDLSYYAGPDRKPLSKALMPDLVYDHTDPSSFKDAWRKICFNKDHFAALISGGAYSRDLQLTGKNSQKWDKLTAGKYTIFANLVKNGKLVAQDRKEIEVGVSPDIACFRFSPSEHFAKVKEFASQNHLKILSDPLAGFWHPADNFSSFKNNSVFAEILPKWRWNDLVEYQNNHIHFFIYNVSDTSATYKVEVGTAQSQNIISNDSRFSSYYYSYGEPEISGAPSSKFVKFLPDKYLAFTRIDFNSDGKDNLLDPQKLDKSTSLLEVNAKDKLNVQRKFALSGVVRPIQNAKQTVKLNSDNTYSFNSKLAYVRYTLTKDKEKEVIVKKIGLDRILSGRNRNSVLEFEHEFNLTSRFTGAVKLQAEVLTETNEVYPSSTIELNLQVA